MNKVVARINNERLSKWKENKEIVTLNPNQITISENIHIKAKGLKFTKEILKSQNNEVINKRIIIRPIDSDKSNIEPQYTLVMGLKGLVVAKNLNKPVTCIILDKDINYEKFRKSIGMLGNYFKVPKETEDIININKIIIPNKFKRSKPNQEKIKQYEEYFHKNKCLDKPITVMKNKKENKNVTLVDQYIRYLIFKKLGIKNVPIKYISLDI